MKEVIKLENESESNSIPENVLNSLPDDIYKDLLDGPRDIDKEIDVLARLELIDDGDVLVYSTDLAQVYICHNSSEITQAQKILGKDFGTRKIDWRDMFNLNEHYDDTVQ